MDLCAILDRCQRFRRLGTLVIKNLIFWKKKSVRKNWPGGEIRWGEERDGIFLVTMYIFQISLKIHQNNHSKPYEKSEKKNAADLLRAIVFEKFCNAKVFVLAKKVLLGCFFFLLKCSLGGGELSYITLFWVM